MQYNLVHVNASGVYFFFREIQAFVSSYIQNINIEF